MPEMTRMIVEKISENETVLRKFQRESLNTCNLLKEWGRLSPAPKRTLLLVTASIACAASITALDSLSGAVMCAVSHSMAQALT